MKLNELLINPGYETEELEREHRSKDKRRIKIHAKNGLKRDIKNITYKRSKNLKELFKEAVIKHEGNKWILYAKDGERVLGRHSSRAKALAQERAIQFSKHAQHLENVKKLPPLDDRETQRALRDALIAENEAVKQYEAIADSISNPKIKKVLQDIADEEKVHAGELMALIKDKKFIEEGKKEVEDLNN